MKSSDHIFLRIFLRFYFSGHSDEKNRGKNFESSRVKNHFEESVSISRFFSIPAFAVVSRGLVVTLSHRACTHALQCTRTRALHSARV